MNTQWKARMYFLDFLSYFGGLFTSIFGGASLMISIYQRFAIDQYLVQALYKKESAHGEAHSQAAAPDDKQQLLRTKVENREPVKIAFWQFALFSCLNLICCCCVSRICKKCKFCERKFNAHKQFQVAQQRLVKE